MRIGRFERPKRESSSSCHQNQGEQDLGEEEIRLNLNVASRRASALCWAEASDRG